MIRIENFSKRYRDDVILEDVSLEVKAGETFVLVGSSGCGKSTLLRHIAGLENDGTGPVTGSITLKNEIPIHTWSENRIRREGIRGPFIGYIFQHSALFDSIPVRENLAWPMRELGRSAGLEEKIRHACERVEINPDSGLLERMPSTLSGGERKRVGLARALILEPEILLYDEPTAGLDPPTVREVVKLIKGLSGQGLTSIVATHDMESTQVLADRIGMISDHKLSFVLPRDEALEDPRLVKYMHGTEYADA